MKKNKIDKVSEDASGALPTADLRKYIEWKANQLLITGFKINACMEALKQYLNFPEQADVIADLKNYLESTIFSIKNFGEMNELTEEVARQYSFSLEARDDCRVTFSGTPTAEGTSLPDHLNRVEDFINTVDIKERQSLQRLSNTCIMLGFHYVIKRHHIEKQYMRKFAIIEHQLRDISYQAIGYWTAKLEEMKRGKNNVEARTIKKENHKEILRQWMQTMTPKECRLRGQKEFDVTDRTILNWMKEIKEEKTTILRNKNVTA